MREILYTETGVRGETYIMLDYVKTGIESPRLLVGRIKPHKEKRLFTPVCISGFPCSDKFSNPFEYGHVMAWELGGPNETTNIVPMYGRWQGNITKEGSLGESWRDMEVDIRKLVGGEVNKYVYVAIVDYDDKTNSYPKQSQDFKDWKQFFDWKDYRIPTSFRIFVEKASSDFGKKLIAAFLNPKAPPERPTLSAKLLKGSYDGTPIYQKLWDHTKLPSQDSEFLLKNLTKTAIDLSFEIHEDEKRRKIKEDRKDIKSLPLLKKESPIQSDTMDDWSELPHSPRREDTFNYIHEHTDEIHELMVRNYGCSMVLAKTMTPGLMVMANKFLGRNIKSWKSSWEERKAEHREAYKKQIKDARFKRFMENRTEPRWK